jgi:CrcB protein
MSVPRHGPGDPPKPHPHSGEPVDSDLDLHISSQRDEWQRHRVVLPVIALGGMVGASARYGADLLWPTASGGVPWATLGVNAVGCLLIGVLMVHVVEVGQAHPLTRPLLGVGVLGGFTTFSIHAMEVTELLDGDRPALASAYLVGTVVVAFWATYAGLWLARRLTRARRRRADRDQTLGSAP